MTANTRLSMARGFLRSFSAKTGNVAPMITSADPHPANPEHNGTRNKAEASKWTVTRPHLRGLVDAVPAQGFGKAALIDIPDLRARV